MKTKKFTFIDVLIIVLIVAVAAVAVIKLSSGGQASKKLVTYKVLVSDRKPEVTENIAPDDNVLLDTNENAYGRVTAVEIKDAEGEYPDSVSGKFVKQTVSERKDIYITVEAEATENEWGYDIGKQHIRVGEKQTISAKEYGLVGYIIEVPE